MKIFSLCISGLLLTTSAFAADSKAAEPTMPAVEKSPVCEAAAKCEAGKECGCAAHGKMKGDQKHHMKMMKNEQNHPMGTSHEVDPGHGIMMQLGKLDLSEEQKKKVQEIHMAIMTKNHASGTTAAQLKTNHEEMFKKIRDILNPAQLKKFDGLMKEKQ